jgi:hypothetical protein
MTDSLSQVTLEIALSYDERTLADLGGAILPDTPISHTPSGGVHVGFARTDLEIRNSAGKHGLGVGLDIRGDSGQAVLPSANSGYWWDPHLRRALELATDILIATSDTDPAHTWKTLERAFADGRAARRARA